MLVTWGAGEGRNLDLDQSRCSQLKQDLKVFLCLGLCMYVKTVLIARRKGISELTVTQLSYNGMPNSLSRHFLQLRDFYFQTVKLGSVNQQA